MEPIRRTYGINTMATTAIMCSLALYSCGTASGPHEALPSLDIPEQSPAGATLDVSEPASSTIALDGKVTTALTNATVSVRTLKLRRGHGRDYSTIARLHRDDAVAVLHIRDDGWVKVQASGGLTGWAWGPLLNMDARKYVTEKYRGMTHILISRNQYMGPDGRVRSLAEVRGLHLRPPLHNVQLTSRYGVRKRHPVNGGHNKMHAGVDLQAEVGTAVRSAAEGVITRVTEGKHYGKFVDIRHRLGFTTRYAHLNKSLVKKGQRVKAGQVIGLSGNTGATTGPHLHFELRRSGRSVRPGTYISGLN